MLTSRALAAVGSVAFAGLLALVGPSILADLDLRIYDSLGRFTTEAPGPGRTTIVAIDERSLSELGRWPWPRRVIGRLVDELRSMGASVIALDVLLAEPERTEAGDSLAPVVEATAAPGDVALAGALNVAPAVAAYAFTFAAEGPPLACVPRALAVVQRQRGTSPPIDGLAQASGAVCSIQLFDGAVAASGFVNAMADADGLVRRTPLLIGYRQAIYPSLALAAALRAEGATTSVLQQRSDGSLMLRIGLREIALDAQGHALLRYLGPGRSTPRVSAADVLAGRVRADAVRGRVVLIGPTALGLGDVLATPLDSAFPGVEVHATAVEGLLSGRVNTRPQFAGIVEFAIAVLAGLAAVWASLRLGHVWGALVAGAMGFGGWLAAGVLLERTGMYVSPLFSIVAVGVGVAFETGRSVVRERARKHAAQRLIVQTLTSLTETRSLETGRHARRTEEYTRLLAKSLSSRPPHGHVLTPERIALISTLAPLHDIGKVGVSDAVLNKAGALTESEQAEMRRHPVLGHESLLKAEALAGAHDDEVLAVAKQIVHTHHEHWDGRGYPRGLRGEEIPIAGRLVALVDVYDALVAARPYRSALPHARAVEIIVEGRGTHFDPDVVDAFVAVQDAFRALAERGGPVAGLTPPRPDATRARERLEQDKQ
jgi:CHASE2 domain-containing sensor protein